MSAIPIKPFCDNAAAYVAQRANATWNATPAPAQAVAQMAYGIAKAPFWVAQRVCDFFPGIGIPVGIARDGASGIASFFYNYVTGTGYGQVVAGCTVGLAATFCAIDYATGGGLGGHGLSTIFGGALGLVGSGPVVANQWHRDNEAGQAV